jgi:Fe2+ or Zn2+ uptake regulation protein
MIKRKIYTLVVMLMMIFSATLIITPKKQNVKADPDIGEIGIDKNLNYTLIYDLAYDLSGIINREDIYPNEELKKGRSYGSKGENYTAWNILYYDLKQILGAENVTIEQINNTDDTDDITSLLDINSFGFKYFDINAPYMLFESECYISPRWNLSIKSGYDRNLLTNNFSYDEGLKIRKLRPLNDIKGYVLQMILNKYNSVVEFIDLIETYNYTQDEFLDFLADHPDYDYNISDISKNSEVSRPTVYKIVEILLKKKLIVKTRESGNSSLYKLNMENKLVQVILKFDFELAGQIAEMESESSVKKYEAVLTSPKAKATTA